LIYFPNYLFVFESLSWIDYIRKLQPKFCIALSQLKRESNRRPSA